MMTLEDYNREVLRPMTENLGLNKTDPLLVERGKTHGNFKMQFTVAQELKLIIQRREDLPAYMTEALEMICVKISRILHGDPHHKDHWDDIAGYAKLVSGNLEQEKK